MYTKCVMEVRKLKIEKIRNKLKILLISGGMVVEVFQLINAFFSRTTNKVELFVNRISKNGLRNVIAHIFQLIFFNTKFPTSKIDCNGQFFFYSKPFYNKQIIIDFIFCINS